jgi:hypothetical protein
MSVSVIALFVALTAGAYAAFHLPKNSVRSKNIVNGQVKRPDLAATGFHSAGLLANPGGLQYCSSANNQWTSVTPTANEPVGYSRDLLGRVHLSGVAQQCGNPPANKIFTLPGAIVRPSPRRRRRWTYSTTPLPRWPWGRTGRFWRRSPTTSTRPPWPESTSAAALQGTTAAPRRLSIASSPLRGILPGDVAGERRGLQTRV